MNKNNPGIQMPMPQAKMKPLTNEEKQAAIERALAQRRESYATAIMYNLIHGTGGFTDESLVKGAAHLAVVGADALIAELFVGPEKDKEGKE